MDNVTYAREGLAGVITLAAEHNRNAINSELIAGISTALHRAYDDDSIRYVVLTHAGSTFSAGADLQEQKSFGATPRDLQIQRGVELGRLFKLMLSGEKPIVATVHGSVRAGGVGLVAACDIAIASNQATFGLPEARIGVAPSLISAVLEKKVLPQALAEMYLRGNTITAVQAAAAGLITRAVDDVEEELWAIDVDFRLAGRQGMAVSKVLANRDVLAHVDKRTDELAELSAELFMSAEAQAGIRAFLAKEPPPWAPKD